MVSPLRVNKINFFVAFSVVIRLLYTDINILYTLVVVNRYFRRVVVVSARSCCSFLRGCVTFWGSLKTPTPVLQMNGVSMVSSMYMSNNNKYDNDAVFTLMSVKVTQQQ